VLANSAALTGETQVRSALASLEYFLDGDGLPREIVPATERERYQRLRFWPEHGVAIGSVVYFYYLGVQTVDEDSTWGFRNAGIGVAMLDWRSGECQRMRLAGDWRLWTGVGEDFHFGVQVMPAGGYLYVFGATRHGLQNSAMLARVRPELIAEPAAYEFLSDTAPAWTPDIRRACPLGPASSEYSVSYNPHLRSYAMTYVDGYHKTLVLRTAAALWGPYSDPVTLARVPHEPTSELIYLGFEHPHFAEAGGRRIYVSYCQPRFTANNLVSITLE
jgi:hypothetical protein